jgi:hypothetical protein
MFREFSHPSLGVHDCSSSLWFYLRIVVITVLCWWLGLLWLVITGWSTNTARLSPQYEGKTRGCYCSHELLMMGGRTPETCWGVKKRRDNKLENCCIWLAIYLNCTMMHGLTNLKFKIEEIIFCHWSQCCDENSLPLTVYRFSSCEESFFHWSLCFSITQRGNQQAQTFWHPKLSTSFWATF